MQEAAGIMEIVHKYERRNASHTAVLMYGGSDIIVLSHLAAFSHIRMGESVAFKYMDLIYLNLLLPYYFNLLLLT